MLEKILETTNLNLNKPELHEQADVTVFNENFDNLDTKIKEVEDKQLEINDGLDHAVPDHELETIKLEIIRDIESYFFNEKDIAEIQQYIDETLAETYVTKENLEKVKQEMLTFIKNDYLTKTEAQNLYATKTEVSSLKQVVNNGKQKVVEALVHNGVEASTADNFQTLANKIDSLSNGIDDYVLKEIRYVKDSTYTNEVLETFTVNNGAIAIFLAVGISYSNGTRAKEFFISIDNQPFSPITKNSVSDPYAPKPILRYLDKLNIIGGGYEGVLSLEFSKNLQVKIPKDSYAGGFFVAILESRHKKNIDSTLREYVMELTESGEKKPTESFTLKGKGVFRPVALSSVYVPKVKIYADGVLCFDSVLFHDNYYMEETESDRASTTFQIHNVFTFMLESIYYENELKVDIEGHGYSPITKIGKFLYQNTSL